MMMKLLNLDQIKQIISMKQVIQDVEEVYKLKSQEQCAVWDLVSYHFKKQQAVMDIRSGYVKGKGIHGLKMLNNFPHNIEKGLPKFSGMLMVFDSETGFPLGVMDASYITCMRTGAAGALGAKYLADPDAKHAFILGAGIQAGFQIAALLTLFPDLKKIYVADPLHTEHAAAFVKQITKRLHDEFHINTACTFEAGIHMADCVRDSQIIITATPSKTPIIQKEWVAPGTHFSCIGADMEGKEEIDPQIMKHARIYCDDIDQCVRVGEIELPIKQGILSPSQIISELGDLIANPNKGRQNRSEITVFDATGLALLDLNTAKTILDLADQQAIGTILHI